MHEVMLVAAACLCLAVLKEALRRYSVVPVVTRSLKEDDMLGGHAVPAGAMIVCHLQVRPNPAPAVWCHVSAQHVRQGPACCSCLSAVHDLQAVDRFSADHHAASGRAACLSPWDAPASEYVVVFLGLPAVRIVSLADGRVGVLSVLLPPGRPQSVVRPDRLPPRALHAGGRVRAV